MKRENGEAVCVLHVALAAREEEEQDAPQNEHEAHEDLQDQDLHRGALRRSANVVAAIVVSELTGMSTAHTSGDIAITFENANIVHLGDLMSYQRNPRADRPAGASVPNWIPVLERIVKDHSGDTVYIFGHSKVGERVTGSSKDVLELRDYLTALVDYAKRQIAAGKSQEEIVKGTMAIPGFERYEGTPFALEAAYLELSGKG